MASGLWNVIDTPLRVPRSMSDFKNCIRNWLSQKHIWSSLFVLSLILGDFQKIWPKLHQIFSQTTV
jgi:hypothetical protein